jgi:hypothetical protein
MNITRHMKTFNTSTLALLLTLSSCAKESANREAPAADTIVDGGTCMFQPDDGESARRPGDSPTQSDPTEFGKRLDLRYLQSALRASMRETAKLVESTGLQLVQVQTARRYTCSPLSFLPFSSPSLNAFWNDRQKPGRTLLGMFLPRLDSDNSDRRATILIRPDTTRWTLVHEFMHALYEFERDRAGAPTNDAQWTTLDQAADALERELDVCEKGTCTNVRETLQAFANYVDLRHAVELSYSIEEISIEAQLSRKYANKELRYVPNETADSHWYASSNLDKSRSAYERIQKTLRWFSKRSVDSGSQTSADASAAESRILTHWKNTLDRALTLTQEIDGYQTRSLYGYGLRRQAGPPKVRDCSHSGFDIREPIARTEP